MNIQIHPIEHKKITIAVAYVEQEGKEPFFVDVYKVDGDIGVATEDKELFQSIMRTLKGI